MATQLRNNADGTISILADASGALSFSPSASVSNVLSISSNNIVFNSNVYIPLTQTTVTGNNILSYDSTLGFYINSVTARNQIVVNGFTFNQDGDVLTPVGKTRYVYTFTGGNQSFTVPSNVSWIYAKLWGAGGGNGRAGGWSYGADGGGGGHTRGLIPVTPGSTIYVVIGSGGTTVNGTTSQYGGGGVGSNNSDITYAGQGGGYCGLFNGGISQGQALAIAGGGGGGGSSRTWNGNVGGAGGGVQGQRGASPYDGKYTAGGYPGTQNGGGAAGSGYSNNGGAGSALQGGVSAVNNYGGGGGGGYYGGAGGSYSESNTMAGGGGGSGYLISTATLGYTYTGAYRYPAFYWDPDLMAGYTSSSQAEMPGYGGLNTQNLQGTGVLTGGHAVAVIYY